VLRQTWNIISRYHFRDIIGIRARAIAENDNAQMFVRMPADVGGETLPCAVMFNQSVAELVFLQAPAKSLIGMAAIV